MDALSFEAALVELEQVLRALEDGSTSLEDGLAKYERGVALLKHCHGQLSAAEKRISILTDIDADGRPVLRPFEPAAPEPAPVKPSAPTRSPRARGGEY